MQNQLKTEIAKSKVEVEKEVTLFNKISSQLNTLKSESDQKIKAA